MPNYERYRKDPQKHKKQAIEYYYKNREEILERQRLFRLNNPEKIKERDKRFYDKHKNSIEYIKKTKENQSKYRNSLAGKYYQYKSGAKGRDYNFDLTIKDFESLWKKPCYYCGEKIESLGIDRKDNNLGYSIDNIVSCCTRCNLMKKAMNQYEFIGHCFKISNNFKNKYDRQI